MPRAVTPGLLLACKQAHGEAIEIYYTTCVFNFPARLKSQFPSWLGKVGISRVRETRLVDSPATRYPGWNTMYYGSEWKFFVYQTARSAKRLLKEVQILGLVKIGVDLGGGYRVWTDAPIEFAAQVIKLVDCSWSIVALKASCGGSTSLVKK